MEFNTNNKGPITGSADLAVYLTTSSNGLAEQLLSNFIGDEADLQKVLGFLGVQDLPRLLEITGKFFQDNTEIEKFSVDRIEQLDLKKLAYDFVKKTGITIPKTCSPEERELTIVVMTKLGRIFLHEMLFPQLIEAHPAIAASVKNLIYRTVVRISNVEGLNKDWALDLLKVEELPTGADTIILPTLLHEERKIRFFDCFLNDAQIERLAKIMSTDYDVFKAWKPFADLLRSKGRNVDVVKTNPKKLRLLIRVIYCLHNASSNTQKKVLLRMNIGKGLWTHAQRSFIDADTGTDFTREFNRISSETNADNIKYSEVITQAAEILNEIFKKN